MIKDPESGCQEEVIKKALGLLQQRDFESAISIASLYNKEMGFANDPWFTPSPETLREQLKRTFAVKPKILSGVDDVILEHCRIAVAMGFLGFGLQWLPENPEIERQMQDMTLGIPSMIISSVQGGMNLDEWRRVGLVRTIKIVGSSDGDSCPACKAAQKRTWPIQKVPELPIADCTFESGCRCGYVIGDLS